MPCFTTITDEALDEVVFSLKDVLPHIGERILLGHLRRNGLVIQRERVRQSIHRVDPLNTALDGQICGNSDEIAISKTFEYGTTQSSHGLRSPLASRKAINSSNSWLVHVTCNDARWKRFVRHCLFISHSDNHCKTFESAAWSFT